jgi:hypothetical protein
MLLEKNMKILVWFSFVGIFLVQTSCNVLLPDIPMTTDPQDPKETQSHSEGNITPVETNWRKTESPTQSITPEIINETSIPNPTSEAELPTQIPTPIPTITKPENLLVVQEGSPVAISNFAHTELGCNWLGLAGQIIDVDSQPIKDIVVEVGGTLEGMPVFGLAVTGESSKYGPGGFEIKLGDEPIESDDTLWVVVYDLSGNKIISPVYFSTYSDCERNLVVINFLKIRPSSGDWVYLPVIINRFSQP